MKSRKKNIRLTNHAISTARPKASEYTLWDGTLNHFGLRVYPSGVRSFVVQIRVQGRMRKITLGRFPATGIAGARKQAAALLARIWSGEPIAPVRKPAAPLFRDFAARYRERRKCRWETVLAGDVRYLPAQPPDAAFRKAPSRYHRSCPGVGLVRCRQRREARRSQPGLRDPEGDAQYRAPMG